MTLDISMLNIIFPLPLKLQSIIESTPICSTKGRFTLWPKVERLSSSKATDSRRKFGSDGNGNPNYGPEAVDFFT